MRVNCFTSFSFSYLPRARVLGWSLKRYHPDWAVTACISDREPEGFVFNIGKEPFDHVIWTDELRIDGIRGWFFKHDVVEICTAVKGPVLDLLTGTNADRILYLDPDIAVMESLQPIVEMLDEHSVLLTPHLVDAETDHSAVLDNEIAPLRHGTYNLGFIAVRNDEKGRKCARWWKSRLMHFCYDDAAQGLFVDQKWCDLVPVFFDGVHIVRDPGYNVASWNINQRKVQVDRHCEIPTPESEGMRERPEPTNEGYGWAKRMEEYLASAYAEEFGMSVAVARPYNAYGPRDNFDPDRSHVIPAIIRKTFDESLDKIVVWGSGNLSRSFLYVTDFGDGLIRICERATGPLPTKVGAGEETSAAHLVQMIVLLSGTGKPVRFDTSRPQGQPRRHCDVTKLERDYNFRARVSLEEGIRATLDYFRQEIRPCVLT